jgi:hypothetical protein
MADLLKQLNSIDKVSMNISLSGTNVWQSGQTIFEYAITEDGAVGPNGYNFNYQEYQEVPQARSAAIDSQLGLHYSNLFAQAFAKTKKDAFDAYQLFAGATSGALPGNPVLSGHHARPAAGNGGPDHRRPHRAGGDAADLLHQFRRLGSSRRSAGEPGHDAARGQPGHRGVL